MGSYYDELAKLDRGIADRWKKRSHENPRFKIRPNDVYAILDPLMKPKGRITEGQSDAIAKLILDGQCTNEALAVLQVYIKAGVDAGLFANGGEVLVTPDEFRPVTSAIGAAMTGRISFRSPGTNFSYLPGHYQAIWDLISKSKMYVFEVRLHSLEIFAHITTAGQYRSDENYLFIYAGLPPALTAMSIVHEVTHAIQDWADVSGKNKHVEADAYIAGAVADIAQGKAGSAGVVTKMYEPALKAAELVVAGQANGSDKPWTDAYKAVLEAIEHDKFYKKTNEDMFDPTRKDEGTREKDEWDKVLAAIAKKTP
jgi:hypothetical protein